MRIHTGAGLAMAALLLSAVGVAAQDRKDGGSGTQKGQSERPASPAHIDPESSSHNAEKPQPEAGTSSTQQPQAGEEKPPEPKPPEPKTTQPEK